MTFTKESRLVQDYILLINKGIRTLEEVPNLLNLRKVVAEYLAVQENLEI